MLVMNRDTLRVTLYRLIRSRGIAYLAVSLLVSFAWATVPLWFGDSLYSIVYALKINDNNEVLDYEDIRTIVFFTFFGYSSFMVMIGYAVSIIHALSDFYKFRLVITLRNPLVNRITSYLSELVALLIFSIFVSLIETGFFSIILLIGGCVNKFRLLAALLGNTMSLFSVALISYIIVSIVKRLFLSLLVFVVSRPIFLFMNIMASTAIVSFLNTFGINTGDSVLLGMFPFAMTTLREINQPFFIFFYILEVLVIAIIGYVASRKKYELQESR